VAYLNDPFMIRETVKPVKATLASKDRRCALDDKH
jgi:hypothetical protein